jgi:iron complex outermembrane receptor protein
VIAYDGLGLYDSGYYIATDASELETGRLGDTYTIDEDLTTLFVRATFDAELGNVPVRGNIGVQYVESDQKSSGYDSFTGDDQFVNAIPSSDGDKYSNVLPSLNVSFEVADGHFVRTALSKTISRPRMDYMKVNNSVSFSFNIAQVQSTDPQNSAWTGNAGNATLKPLEANQFDLAYDWYFAEDGFVSAAYFYKDLVNWHRNSSFIADFSQFYIPGYHQVVDPSNGSIVTPATFQGLVNYREDGLEGDVNGIELQTNLPFHIFSEKLDGFGLNASASFNDGDFEDGSSIPGLSEETYNVTFYFEYGGFQARIAGTKRDKFLTETRGISLSLVETIDQGAELLDAQISYDFGLGGFDKFGGLTISLQAQNITDEDTVQSNDADPRQITLYQGFGSNYLLGINYKFQ